MSEDTEERCPHGIRWPHECRDCLEETVVPPGWDPTAPSSHRTEDQMTLPELESLLGSLIAERQAMSDRIAEVERRVLAAKAPFKIGDTIEWDSYRGKIIHAVVRSHRNWCGAVAYGVQHLRKDGSPGASRIVYPHDKPRASTVAYVPEENT